MLVECQDSIVRGQMAFPAIRRSLRKAASHRAASYHLDRGTNSQVLVQRQKAAPQGLRAVLAGRVHEPFGTAHSRTLSARCSELWAVCSARSLAHLGSHLCHSETGAEATPQTSPLGEVHRTRLRI